MNKETLSTCRAFVSAHLSAPREASRKHAPAVTLSREMGAGGQTIANLVCARLKQSCPPKAAPWTVFDKNLVQQILDDHDLPDQLAEFMREEAEPPVSEFLEEFLGARPPAWQLFEHTSNTLLKLATMGRCVLVGRAANFVTANLNHVLHVRLVASFEARVARIQARDQVSAAEAEDKVRDSDRGRARYVRKHFDRKIDDPAHYHLILNTEELSPEASAAIIAAAVLATIGV